jgi:flagellar FliJ protein
MARFIFRMQSILNVKHQLEEQAKLAFAMARRRLDEEEERLAALCARKEEYMEEGRRLRGDRLHVFGIKENKEFIMTMDGYIDLQRLEVKRAENELEIARLAMNEAIKERKTYERLREKAFEEFMHEVNVRETKEVDEITSYKHAVAEPN